jgi:hypothetical protein
MYHHTALEVILGYTRGKTRYRGRGWVRGLVWGEGKGWIEGVEWEGVR